MSGQPPQGPPQMPGGPPPPGRPLTATYVVYNPSWMAQTDPGLPLQQRRGAVFPGNAVLEFEADSTRPANERQGRWRLRMRSRGDWVYLDDDVRIERLGPCQPCIDGPNPGQCDFDHTPCTPCSLSGLPCVIPNATIDPSRYHWGPGLVTGLYGRQTIPGAAAQLLPPALQTLHAPPRQPIVRKIAARPTRHGRVRGRGNLAESPPQNVAIGNVTPSIPELLTFLPRSIRRRRFALHMANSGWRQQDSTNFMNVIRGYSGLDELRDVNTTLKSLKWAMKDKLLGKDVPWTPAKHQQYSLDANSKFALYGNDPNPPHDRELDKDETWCELKDLAKGVAVFPKVQDKTNLSYAVDWAMKNPDLKLKFPDDVDAAAQAELTATNTAPGPTRTPQAALLAWQAWWKAEGKAWLAAHGPKSGTVAATAATAVEEEDEGDKDDEERDEGDDGDDDDEGGDGMEADE